MSRSDDKHSKLSTLSQDVIAVGQRPAATPLRTQERRGIPPAQDVFKVPAESDAPRSTASTRAHVPTPAAAPAATSPVTWIALTLAVVAVGVALYLASRPAVVQPVAAPAPVVAPAATPVAATTTVPAAAVTDPGLASLREELRKASERVQKLEQQMAAAPVTSASTAAPAAATTLQTSAALREMQNRLDAISNEQQKIAAQIADIRNQVATAGKDAKAAQLRGEQLATRVTALADSSPKAAPAGGDAGAQAQLKALGQKTDKMATDIRQLYRLLENR